MLVPSQFDDVDTYFFRRGISPNTFCTLLLYLPVGESCSPLLFIGLGRDVGHIAGIRGLESGVEKGTGNDRCPASPYFMYS